MQRQELFSYRDICMRPVGRDFLMRDTFNQEVAVSRQTQLVACHEGIKIVPFAEKGIS